ncbi:MAG: hypothetical protein Q8N23_04340 [Archangium sp.]|nr:hypothetical protein [Archangium sp.]MDP3151871.1 hypothetical protein [Archangium sp.]MDP3574384.1 hypothetical protein [Archangium sp.]
MEALPRMTVRRDDALPKLAWYAVIDRRADTCDAEVGRFVEVDPTPSPRWIISGMWSGDFVAGNFHTAEHLYGSGLRVDDDEVVVSTAHTTIERCVYIRDGQLWHVSNSLSVLLGRTGARLHPEADHRRWSESICLGVYNYVRQFAIAHPRLEVANQLMFEAMHLDAKGEPAYRTHDVPHTFTGFSDYISQLSDALRSLWSNATDPRRARPMRAVSTASRGYDSPTVVALMQPIVGTPLLTWSSAHSNTRIPLLVQKLMKTELSNDDGSDIARLLGARPKHLDLDESQLPAEIEAWFWASSQTSPELVFHSLLREADAHDVPTVWFGGHMGDGVWAVDLSPMNLTGQLWRGAPSGFSLNEARARFGVVECSPGFLFSRSVTEVHRVTLSDEMAPWRLSNGYDRPICRRILEERGVPREAFGWGKKAVAEDMESPQGDELRAMFFERTGWSKLTETLYRDLNLGYYLSTRAITLVEQRGSRTRMMMNPGRSDGKHRLARFADLQKSTFLMASGWLADRYAKGKD